MSHSPETHDEHTAEHVAAHVKKYILVGITLLAFTLLTVFLSYVDINKIFKNGNMIVGMIVATFKAGLVAAIFMHLAAERWTIYRFLLLTAFFVAGLFLLTWFAYEDPIRTFWFR